MNRKSLMDEYKKTVESFATIFDEERHNKLIERGERKISHKALWGALEAGLTDACRNGAQLLAGMWGHPDQEEGPLAFAEKRDPRWAELSAER